MKARFALATDLVRSLTVAARFRSQQSRDREGAASRFRGSMREMFYRGMLSLFVFTTIVLVAAEKTKVPPENLVWKAGVASAVITPETNLWMAGYAARTKPAEGKAQDLFAKALALEDASGSRLVLVTMDLIGVPSALRKVLEPRVAEAYKLAPEAFVLNASHTHCGPEFRVGRAPADDGEFKPSTLGERYGQQLETTLFKLIGDALKELAPARLAYSHARCGFAMNRRLPVAGGYKNSPYPDGPVDPDVPVLSVQGADGKLRAVLFGYACHNTTLSFYQFCGDYAGFAQEYLQADNPGVIALFLNGCSGDQNPYPRGTLELAQRHGRTLATAVEAALSVAAPRPMNGPVRAALAEVDLDYSPPPTREEFRQRLESKDKYIAAHAKRMLAKLDAGEPLPTSYPCPVQVIHFGDDLLLVAIGGEVVVDYALRLKKELAGKAAVWIAGYSNDVMAYVPSRRVREEGGYEGVEAMRFSVTHPGPWAPTLEEKIVAKVHELHRQLGRR